MPFALLIVGLALLISGVRNTQDKLYELVKNDFAGDNNFIYWSSSIVLIGSVGYIDRLKPVANSFMGLLVLSMLLSKQGETGISFFERITAALNGTEKSPNQEITK